LIGNSLDLKKFTWPNNNIWYPEELASSQKGNVMQCVSMGTKEPVHSLKRECDFGIFQIADKAYQNKTLIKNTIKKNTNRFTVPSFTIGGG
jgi:hypothetical protein